MAAASSIAAIFSFADITGAAGNIAGGDDDRRAYFSAGVSGTSGVSLTTSEASSSSRSAISMIELMESVRPCRATIPSRLVRREWAWGDDLLNGEFGIVTGLGDVGEDGFVGSVVSGKCVILGEPGTTCGECRMEPFSDPRLISDFPISDPPPITDPLGSNTSSVPFAYTNLTWLRGSGKVDGANEGGGCKTRGRVTPTEEPGRDSGRDRIGSDGERLGDSPSMPIGEAPGGRGESSGGVGDEFRDEGCMLFAKKNFPWLG